MVPCRLRQQGRFLCSVNILKNYEVRGVSVRSSNNPTRIQSPDNVVIDDHVRALAFRRVKVTSYTTGLLLQVKLWKLWRPTGAVNPGIFLFFIFYVGNLTQ